MMMQKRQNVPIDSNVKHKTIENKKLYESLVHQELTKRSAIFCKLVEKYIFKELAKKTIAFRCPTYTTENQFQ